MVEHRNIGRKVEFDIIEDGAVVRRVSKGVLVEADGKTLKYHWGGSMAAFLFGMTHGLLATIYDLGLGDEFKKYVTGALEKENSCYGEEEIHTLRS